MTEPMTERSPASRNSWQPSPYGKEPTMTEPMTDDAAYDAQLAHDQRMDEIRGQMLADGLIYQDHAEYLLAEIDRLSRAAAAPARSVTFCDTLDEAKLARSVAAAMAASV